MWSKCDVPNAVVVVDEGERVSEVYSGFLSDQVLPEGGRGEIGGCPGRRS
jgi:hypothetical protein